MKKQMLSIWMGLLVAHVSFASASFVSADLRDPFEVFMPSASSSHVSNSYKDPSGTLTRLDSLLADWTFEDAFKVGDRADYYAQSCQDVAGKKHCLLQPLSLEVIEVTASGASVLREFQGRSPEFFEVTRDYFQTNKNLLRAYVERIDATPSTEVGIESGELVTEQLGDSPSYTGLSVDFAYQESEGNHRKGHIFLGIKVPWVASLGSLTYQGNAIPSVVLRSYGQNSRRGQ